MLNGPWIERNGPWIERNAPWIEWFAIMALMESNSLKFKHNTVPWLLK